MNLSSTASGTCAGFGLIEQLKKATLGIMHEARKEKDTSQDTFYTSFGVAYPGCRGPLHKSAALEGVQLMEARQNRISRRNQDHHALFQLRQATCAA
jgi:hypothetical protein